MKPLIKLFKDYHVINFSLLFISYCAIVLLLFVSGHANSLTINQGTSFAIVEPDLLAEIQQKAEQVDWQQIKKSINIKNNQAQLLIAKKDREIHHTPIAKLPFEIKDENNKVIYPKGFEFNPLLYTQIPGRIIVVASPQHLKTLAKAPVPPLLSDIVLVANIPLAKFKNIKQKVYLLTQSAAQRLGLKNAPAIISQQQDYLVINEFVPNNND